MADITALPTEILGAILLELYPQQLLRAQRVCRTFRDTIRGSMALQRRVFLQPSTEGLYEANTITENDLLRGRSFRIDQLSGKGFTIVTRPSWDKTSLLVDLQPRRTRQKRAIFITNSDHPVMRMLLSQPSVPVTVSINSQRIGQLGEGARVRDIVEMAWGFNERDEAMMAMRKKWEMIWEREIWAKRRRKSGK